MTRPASRCINTIPTILFVFPVQESSFCGAGHAAYIQDAKTLIIVQEKRTLKGAAYFCACLFKSLDLRPTKHMRTFYKHSSKIRHAQNGGMVKTPAQTLAAQIQTLTPTEIYGRVTKILGPLVEIAGFGQTLSIGSIVHLKPTNDTDIPCEVVGFRDSHAMLMPFGTLEGVGLGCKAVIQQTPPIVQPDESWLGRVINALGEPIDGKGPLTPGAHPVPLKNKPPVPHSRQRLGDQLDLGVRAVNSFLATCQGQRAYSPALV